MEWNLLFTALFVILFALVALYASVVPQGDRRWWALLAGMALLIVSGMALNKGLWHTLLIDAAALVAVAMVWTARSPRAAGAARTYLALMIAAIACIGAGLWLGPTVAAGSAAAKIVTALLLVGFGLKLALVPFFMWLPAVAEAAAPMTTALIVSVVDVAAFTELAHLRSSLPWVFEQHAPLWLGMALLSMFGGALLALAQRDIKRMLAFSTVDDMGYLLLGVLAGPEVGMTGALLGALSHALLKVLLFASIGTVEAKQAAPVTLDNSRGLAARYPISGLAFIIGALGMIGVPPTFGFVGRWRLYLTGVSYGGPALALAMAAATALALLYYVRAIHRVWLGSPAADGPATGNEPRLAAGVLIVLSVLVLLLGLFPNWITGGLA